MSALVQDTTNIAEWLPRSKRFGDKALDIYLTGLVREHIGRIPSRYQDFHVCPNFYTAVMMVSFFSICYKNGSHLWHNVFDFQRVPFRARGNASLPNAQSV